jgi:hypothetical protein
MYIFLQKGKSYYAACICVNVHNNPIGFPHWIDFSQRFVFHIASKAHESEKGFQEKGTDFGFGKV